MIVFTAVIPTIIMLIAVGVGIHVATTSIDRRNERRCPACEYNLRGHPDLPGRCPECGAHVTKSDLPTEEWDQHRFWYGVTLIVLGFVGLLWMLFTAMLL